MLRAELEKLGALRLLSDVFANPCHVIYGLFPDQEIHTKSTLALDSTKLHTRIPCQKKLQQRMSINHINHGSAPLKLYEN